MLRAVCRRLPAAGEPCSSSSILPPVAAFATSGLSLVDVATAAAAKLSQAVQGLGAAAYAAALHLQPGLLRLAPVCQHTVP